MEGSTNKAKNAPQNSHEVDRQYDVLEIAEVHDPESRRGGHHDRYPDVDEVEQGSDNRSASDSRQDETREPIP